MSTPILSVEALNAHPSQEVLSELSDFIKGHYIFSIDPQYKGFFGKLRAITDKEKIEEREELSGRAHVRPQPEFIRPEVYFSGPNESNAHLQEMLRAEAEFMKNLAKEKKFADSLLELISERGRDTVDVYKSANLDRRLFSKIRNTEDYIPSKKTVLAFAIALELSLEETQELLAKAGYTLSRSILFDVIIEYFISHKMYNIFEINNVLCRHKQQLLGEIKNVASKATQSNTEYDNKK